MNFVKSKRILVPGGTGAMGVYLVPELVAMGAKVYVTSRREKRATDNVTYLRGNAHDFEFLQQCVKTVKPDAIVDFMNYKTPEFEERARYLVEATNHYLFLSSYRVFADAYPIVENSPRLLDVSQDKEFLSTDIYPLAKARQEDIVQALPGLHWSIIRPCITYSAERFQFGCLEANTVCYRSFQNVPVVIPSAMLDCFTTMTWGGDVAKMIAQLVLNPAAKGESFNVVTSETHTWREVGAIYSKLIGLKYQEVTTEDYIRVIGEHYRYQTIYDRLFNRVLNNSKVLSVTGLSQDDFLSLEHGLTLELKKFKAHPYYPFLNVPENARMDCKCRSQIDLGALTPDEVKSYRESCHVAE